MWASETRVLLLLLLCGQCRGIWQAMQLIGDGDGVLDGDWYVWYHIDKVGAQGLWNQAFELCMNQLVQDNWQIV